MRGISAVLATIMIVIITVALIGLAYTWSTNLFDTFSESGDDTVDDVSETADDTLASVRISSASQYTLNLRNTGSVDLHNFTLYKSGVMVPSSKYSVTPPTLTSGQTGTVKLLTKLYYPKELFANLGEKNIIKISTNEGAEAAVLISNLSDEFDYEIGIGSEDLILNGGFDSHSDTAFDYWNFYTKYPECVMNTSIDYSFLNGGAYFCNNWLWNTYSGLNQSIRLDSLTEIEKETIVFSFDTMWAGWYFGQNCGPDYYGSCYIDKCLKNYISLDYFNSSGDVIGKSIFYHMNLMGNTDLPNNCSFTNTTHFRLYAPSVFIHRSHNINEIIPQDVKLNDVSKMTVTMYIDKTGEPGYLLTDNVSLVYLKH